MDLELLRLRRRPHASLPVPPFRRRRLSVTRLTIGSSNIRAGTHHSVHTDLNPVALLVIPHMFSVHYNDGVKVACVAYLLTTRADFKQLQVSLWLAFCRNTPTDTTPVLVRFSSLKDSVAPLSTTLVFARVIHHAFANWLGLQSLIRSCVECRLPPLEPLQASEDHVPALGGRVLSCILILLGSAVQAFSVQGPQLQ